MRGDFGDERFSEARFSDSVNSFSLTITRFGVLYLGERNYVRDFPGLVAGVRGSANPGSPKGKQGADADGVPAREAYVAPAAIAVDPDGKNLYIAEGGSPNGSLRKVGLGTRTIESFATITSQPVDVAADENGYVYVGGRDGSITKMDVSGNKTDLQAVTALTGLAVDPSGSRLFASSGNAHTVVKIDPLSPGISPQSVAGEQGREGSTGDGGRADAALLSKPQAVALDPTGNNLYVLDQTGPANANKNKVRHVDLTVSPSMISTVVGEGATTKAKDLRFQGFDLVVGPGNTLFILDKDQCEVRLVQDPRNAPPTTLTTLEGAGQQTLTTNTTLNLTTPPTSVPAVVEITDPATVVNSDPVPTPNADTDAVGSGVQTDAPARSFSPNVGGSPFQATSPNFGGNANFGANPGVGADPSSAVVAPNPAPDPAASAVVVNAPPHPVAPAATPGSVLPPGAPQPAVNNPGLVSADREAARGATRYAMVRNEDESSMTGAATLVGGAIVTVFLCLMIAAPRAASKPKPRPRGAY